MKIAATDQDEMVELVLALGGDLAAVGWAAMSVHIEKNYLGQVGDDNICISAMRMAIELLKDCADEAVKRVLD